MYYNSNQNSNEYYSSYKQELSAVKPKRRNKNLLSLPIKAGIGLLLLGLIGFAAPHLVKLFSKDDMAQQSTNSINEVSIKKKNVSPNEDEESNDIPKIIIAEESLPKSIQIKNSELKIISHLKENATDSLEDDSPIKSKEHNEIKKQVIALEETSNMNAADIETIVNLILAKKQEKHNSSLEEELLNAEQEEHSTQTLQESNHYNKVVLSAKNENIKSENINNEIITLDHDFSESTSTIKLSTYEKALKPEIATRSNEMRIIVVKKGDSLSKLAFKAYGDKLAYDKIFKANPEIIKNPNEIFIGQKIRIPL